MLQTCDSTFVYPEHYKKHLRIHSGDKVTRSEEGILFQTLNNAAFFFFSLSRTCARCVEKRSTVVITEMHIDLCIAPRSRTNVWYADKDL